MGKYYTILKDFREIPVGIIIWLIFDFKMAIILILGYQIGQLIGSATEAFKRYRPSMYHIEAHTIKMVKPANTITK